MTTARCQAAHPEDRTPCTGPHDAVTVLDAHNAGATGCEHHAARLLASLDGGRVYSGSVDGATIRVFNLAADMEPFMFLTGSAEPPPPAMRLTGTRGEINLMVVRLRSAFSTVEPGDVYLGDDGYAHCDVEVTF